MVKREDVSGGGNLSKRPTIVSLEPGELLRRIEALERLNAELARQNADLRAEVERLKRRQYRQAAPFSKQTRVPKPKRPGRKPGQGTFTHRTAPPVEALSEAPIAVPVTEPVCPYCGGELGEAAVELASITDLPERPRPLVRQYQIGVCRCQCCGRRVRGRHPDLAADQYGATAHRAGPRLKATGQALHYGHGVPLRKVPAILAELTGATVTQGALTQDALQQASGPVGQVYQALRTSIVKADRIHTDDTGWRVGGMPAQLMAFTTPMATVYQIRDRHRNQEVREVIPADYPGVLCTDRGKSYDARELAAVKQQKCVAHLLRSISEVLETKWGRGRSFGLGLRRLFREALTLWQAYQAGDAPAFAARAEDLKTRLDVLLQGQTHPDPDNQRLLEQLRWQHQRGHLLRFLDDPAIEPTNNRAERVLRPAVIARKVSQCSKNQQGADAYAAYTSLACTARQRGESVRDVFAGLYGARACHAQYSKRECAPEDMP